MARSLGAERLVEDTQPVPARDRLKTVSLVSALSERVHESRVLVRRGEPFEPEARLCVHVTWPGDRDDLVDEVRPEADVVDAHHGDGMVHVIDPAREGRILRVDE